MVDMVGVLAHGAQCVSTWRTIAPRLPPTLPCHAMLTLTCHACVIIALHVSLRHHTHRSATVTKLMSDALKQDENMLWAKFSDTHKAGTCVKRPRVRFNWAVSQAQHYIGIAAC